MDSERGTPTNRIRDWRAGLAPGILVAGLMALLCALVAAPVPAAGQSVPADPAAAYRVPSQVTQPAVQPVAHPSPVHTSRAAVSAVTALPSTQASLQVSPLVDQADEDQSQMELDGALAELKQSRENMTQASEVQRRTLIACALFLVAFAFIAVGIVVLVYLQARKWNKRSLESVQRAEELTSQLQPLKDARDEVRDALPRLLQEVGEYPLGFEEVGQPFAPRALSVLDDIDHLAYLGDARLFFSKLSSPQELAVYLNGLLLSGVAQLARSDPWTGLTRLDQFFDFLGRHPEAVDRHRIAQGYSYRALAAYQVLDAQDKEPSWLRKAERSQVDALSRQAFADVAQSARLDPEWKHATFVEAQLCGRFYLPDEPADTSSRSELYVRGLRRAVALYKGLIEERHYRGPARMNLARCLKRIAEQTGEKSDFSDFGYAVSAFPTDEELADEALASRQPGSQDRFLWQWMLADKELFQTIDRLSLAEYRAFWIRLLDNKVHLRNWRADLGELQQRDPAMRNWSAQLLYVEGHISLANTASRRQERFESPSSSGA